MEDPVSHPTPPPASGPASSAGTDQPPALFGQASADSQASALQEGDGESETTTVKALKREAQSLRAQLRKAESEREQLRQASLSEQEQLVAKAREEGAIQWRDRYQKTVRDNEALKLLNAKGVTGAELALGALDLSNVDVDPQSGAVDVSAIEERINTLLARYPMLTGGNHQPPSLPPATGADQRRITAPSGVVGNDRDKLNESLRWALGSGSR